ncbi:MAG: hypothetical protein WCT52_03150 [Candidatus Micrarchaeia archaeon]
MMFLFQVGAQKLVSDEKLQQTQQAFQKFTTTVSTPKSDPQKTVSPALIPLILFESNSDAYKSVRDAFSKGDLNGTKTAEVFDKYRNYLESVKGKIDAKLYEESMRILDKIMPAKQEQVAKQENDFTKTSTQTRGITPVKTTTESALSIEKKIFDRFVSGAPGNADGLFTQLKTALNDDVKYANFLSVMRGGVVDGKFFTSNWNNFQSLLKMVDNSVSPNSKSGTIFKCGTKEEADAFRTALSQIKCIKLTKTNKEDIAEVSAKLNNPLYVPVVFTYAKQEDEAKQLSLPTKQAKTGSTTLSRTNIYKMWLGVNYDIKAKEDVKPATNQIILSSKSDMFDINYNAQQQLVFARNFNPKDAHSIEMVSQLATEQLNRFLAEKGLNLDKLSKMKTADKVALLKEMRVVGAATLESPKQWKENYELATLRAKMLGTALVETMFAGELGKTTGKKRNSEIESYMKNFNNGRGVEDKVVSPWYSPALNKLDPKITKQEAGAVLNSIMTRIRSGEGDNANDVERNFNASTFLYSLMTGNYKGANALASGSTLPKKEKDELLKLVKLTEKTSDGKPAVTYDSKTKQYGFTNEALAQRLWLTQGNEKVGLRYEIAKQSGSDLNVTLPTTAKEKLGAFFVSQLEEGYTRSASLLRSNKGTLSITLENYYEEGGEKRQYTPISQVVAGKTYYATIGVSYEVGGKKEEFNGKVVAGMNSKGNVYAWANNNNVEAESMGMRKDGTYEYRLKFTPEAGVENRIDAVAYKFFDGQRVSSGFVTAPLKLVPVMKKIEPPPVVEKKADLKSNFMELSNIPFFSANVNANYSIVKLGEDAPYSNIINSKMGDVVSQNGGKEIMVNGVPYFSFSNLTPQQLIEVLNKVPEVYTAYLNSDINPQNPTGTTVRQELANTGLISNMSQFEQHLKSKNFDAAIGLINQTGDEGKALALAFGTYKNAVSTLEYAQLAQELENSRYGAIVEVKLDAGAIIGNTDLYLYYNNRQGNFSLTKSPYSVQTAGMRLVKKFDNARLRFQSGYTWSNSKLEAPGQWFVGIGGEYGIPLSEVLTATIQADATKTFGTKTVKGDIFNISLEGKHIINMSTGLTYAPSDVIKAKIMGGVQIQAGNSRTPSYAPFMQAGVSLAPFGKGIEFIPQMTAIKGRPPIYELGVRVNF